MIDFIKQIENKKEQYGIESEEFTFDLTVFLVSNMWFGEEPQVSADGELIVSESQYMLYEPFLDDFCRHYGCSEEEKEGLLLHKLEQQLPKTEKIFRHYKKDVKLDATVANRLLDFLLYFLPGELETSTDKEIQAVLSDGFDNLPKAFGDLLADFINWTRSHYKTFYYNEYFMNPYARHTQKNEA